jgi:hypothetical protein
MGMGKKGAVRGGEGRGKEGEGGKRGGGWGGLGVKLTMVHLYITYFRTCMLTGQRSTGRLVPPYQLRGCGITAGKFWMYVELECVHGRNLSFL